MLSDEESSLTELSSSEDEFEVVVKTKRKSANTTLTTSKTLLSLNYDVLLLIFEFVRTRYFLRPLASTCRLLRQLSMPVLFARVLLRSSVITPKDFIPESVRSYVRSMRFFCDYDYNYPTVWKTYKTPSRRASHKYPNHEFLTDALSKMTRLRNVVVDPSVDTGLPFWVLDAIFSTPHISSVEFGPSLCLPAEFDGSIPKHLRLTGPVASLTSFRRPVRTDTQYSQTPEEAKLLLCLFKRIHHTIEVVEMPIETAPFGAFRRRDWPCLRELILRGGPRRSLRAYLLENLTRMPNLRVLKLELAHSSESGPQHICPPGWTGGCPWPELEVLTVSNPHPDEELFAHLPDSLQELTIRCFPRRYAVAYSWAREIKIMHEYGWGLTLPTSDELLRLLRRCGTSLVRLRHLDIEFAASSEDIGLMRHIATAFPTLAFLQIFRYRTNGCAQDVAFWTALGQALAPLTTLRLLRVHFDLRRTENLDETGIYQEGLVGITSQHKEAVTALSCALSPTVQFVCVMVIRDVSFEWIPYRIVRDPTSREAFRVECADKEYECIDGYSMKEAWRHVRNTPGRRRTVVVIESWE